MPINKIFLYYIFFLIFLNNFLKSSTYQVYFCLPFLSCLYTAILSYKYVLQESQVIWSTIFIGNSIMVKAKTATLYTTLIRNKNTFMTILLKRKAYRIMPIITPNIRYPLISLHYSDIQRQKELMHTSNK